MCRISRMGADWVVKGFHIHVYGIELAMRPDHVGGIVFKKWFRSTSDAQARVAINRANELLMDLAWRRRFHREVSRGTDYLKGIGGGLSVLAQGRSAEFAFLARALRKMGIT